MEFMIHTGCLCYSKGINVLKTYYLNRTVGVWIVLGGVGTLERGDSLSKDKGKIGQGCVVGIVSADVHARR